MDAMGLEQAESLVRRFLGRAETPPKGPPRRKLWKAKRPIGDADLAALDDLMRSLLGLSEFDVRRLCRRLGVEAASARHESNKKVQHRWALFQHLKRQIIDLRGSHVVRQGAKEAGEAAAGAERPVGLGEDV